MLSNTAVETSNIAACDKTAVCNIYEQKALHFQGLMILKLLAPSLWVFF